MWCGTAGLDELHHWNACKVAAKQQRNSYNSQCPFDSIDHSASLDVGQCFGWNYG